MATANEEEIREQMAEMVSSGQLSATTPCDGMYNDWSEEDTEKFKVALADMLGFAHAEAPIVGAPVIWTEADVHRLDKSLNEFFGSSK